MLAEMCQDGFQDYSALLHCAVYALVRRGVPVYIGKTTTVHTRLHEHIRKRGKNPAKKSFYGTSLYNGIMFDNIWVLPCMLAELDELERQMIKKYRPKFNVRHNPDVPKAGAEMPPEVRAMIEKMSAVKETETPSLTFNRRGF